MTEALVKCLAIAASICLSRPATIEVDDSPSWSGAKISFAEASIISTIHTDNFAYPDRRKMNRYCVDGSCLFYYKNCSSEVGKYQCSIYYNYASENYNHSIKVASASEKSLNDTLATARLVVLSTGKLIPLASLRLESANAMPPFCRPKQSAGCR